MGSGSADESDEDAPPRSWGGRIERRLDALERNSVVLFGHQGQPGMLTTMSLKVEKLDQRLGVIEQLRWKLAGAVVLAGSLTGVILFALARILDK